MSPSPQCNSNVGVVLPNGKVGRNGDTQPQLGSAFGVSLGLKLAKPVTRAEDGHKRQRHAVGAGNLCREGDPQDKGIPPSEQRIHAASLRLQSLAVVVLWRLLTGELHLAYLHVLDEAGVDTQRGRRTERRHSWSVAGGRPGGAWDRAVKP